MKKSTVGFFLGYGLIATYAVGVSCTAPQRFVATAEAFKVAADEFVSTSQMMDAALAAHTVTLDQYRRWALFSKRFQASFNLAVDLYEAALKVDDKLTADKAAEVVGQLASSLAEFYEAVSKVGPETPAIPDAGGPP